MKTIGTLLVAILLSLSANARFYSVMEGFHDLGNGCIFFHVTFYDDHDTGNPGDDTSVAGGWIGTGDCYSSLQGGLTEFDSNELNISQSNFDMTELGNAEELEISKEYHLQIFPNPASESITIQTGGFPCSDGVLYQVGSGNKVKQFMLDGKLINQKTLDISKFPSGTYILILYGDNKIATKNFIIE